MSQAIDKASRWMYRGLWSALVDWFRVPDEPPTLPAADASESVVSFRPAEGYLRYLKFWFWIVLLAIDIALTVGYIAAAIALSLAGLWWVALLLLPPAAFIIVAPDVVAFIALHLRYDTMWYAMTDRSLRIRRGIWIIHEVTITFENVQNISVRSGPVQRHFGIANLIIETAGAGATTGKHGSTTISNQGVIEGIANAEELRDRVMRRLRQSKTAGLGDEEQARYQPISGPMWTPDHLEALRGIRDELRAMAAA